MVNQSEPLEAPPTETSREARPEPAHASNDSLNDESSAISNLSAVDDPDTVVTKIESKTFTGVPKDWHETIQVRNVVTQRVKLYFKCKHEGCKSVFKKSCNLRDHFRKHTGQRPFTCAMCKKTFTQSGNLGRHLKNVHHVPRDAQAKHLRLAGVPTADNEEHKKPSKAPRSSKQTPKQKRQVQLPAGSDESHSSAEQLTMIARLGHPQLDQYCESASQASALALQRNSTGHE